LPSPLPTSSTPARRRRARATQPLHLARAEPARLDLQDAVPRGQQLRLAEVAHHAEGQRRVVVDDGERSEALVIAGGPIVPVKVCRRVLPVENGAHRRLLVTGRSRRLPIE
jgi:hypothetical protein